MLDLEAIKERLGKATSGPWHPMLEASIKMVYGPSGERICRMSYEPERIANALLIAHAPTDIAALVEEVERLREENTAAYFLLSQEFKGKVDALRAKLEFAEARATEGSLACNQCDWMGYVSECEHSHGEAVGRCDCPECNGDAEGAFWWRHEYRAKERDNETLIDAHVALEEERDALRAMLEEILDCPHAADEATIPNSVALDMENEKHRKQVVLEYSISLDRVYRARKLLGESK